ncbi:DUF6876 family protein [Methylobacillus sp.]|uniref:DUF6876 family protein n=1 Tax=Methylobacillus sp. TaxID=56818 RepID=UPI0012CDD9F2|nr:DUF6876 family protein [Methylobacillus sp.]MPS48520.1 hypothetical protein [Methylobacillus sp.]
MISTEDLRHELAHCTGSENWYKHSLTALVYTDGVKLFAEKAGAYWLLDIVGTEMLKLVRGDDRFASITMTVTEGNKVVIVARQVDANGDDVTTYTKPIEYTDCPVGEWKFFLINDGEQIVMLLISEY